MTGVQTCALPISKTYDDLEARIDRLAEQEELASIRPDLDGNDIMQILGITPSRAVGEAYDHLLEIRLDQGPMGREAAEVELRRWWSERTQ